MRELEERRDDALADLGAVEVETRGKAGLIDDFVGGYVQQTGLDDE